MVSARRPPSFLIPSFLVAAGALSVLGLLGVGGHERELPVPLLAVVLGTWLLLRPGSRHLETAAPLGDLADWHLTMLTGGADVQVRCHDLGDDLFRASLTARTGMPRTEVDREHGRVAVALPRPWWRSVLGQPYPARAVLTLSSRVSWAVELRGDAVGGRVDLGSAPLRSVSLAAGGGEVQVDLPAPVGVVPVRFEGSRLRALVTVPEGVAVQVIREPGTWHVVELGGRDDVRDRYDVTLAGGGRLRLERR